MSYIGTRIGGSEAIPTFRVGADMEPVVIEAFRFIYYDQLPRKIRRMEVPSTWSVDAARVLVRHRLEAEGVSVAQLDATEYLFQAYSAGYPEEEVRTVAASLSHSGYWDEPGGES